MLSSLIENLRTAIMRYSLERLPEVTQFCRVEELGITVFHKSADDEYTLLWDEDQLARKYEVSSYLRGDHIFYIQSRSDRHERCWIKEDGSVVYHDRKKTFEVNGVDKLSHEPWGVDTASQVWLKAQESKDRAIAALIAYSHKYYCGQGLFWMGEPSAIAAKLPGEGLGIFTVEDGVAAEPIFYWTDRDVFIQEFSQLTDYGMSGAENSPFYAKLQTDNFSLNNQTLTYKRIANWLSVSAPRLQSSS